MNLFGYDFQAEYIICGLAGMVLLLLIFDIIQFAKISNLKKRIAALTEGSEGSLEDKIAEKFAQVTKLREVQAKNTDDIDKIFRKLKNAYQKSSVHRYDSLADMGGRLSSVIVLLDERNDGFLINSVHSTTAGTYTYVKKITNGLADVELAEEETLALAEAMGKKN
ncbi:MAG: DUF4446 family protein [Catonella sp.]|uniref:DUF4446 family protein n=1 Tax=Catonella sp. TaxID=2382125 RepID=UPI003FA0376F